jgi:tRNA pseudouridine55 synthase
LLGILLIAKPKGITSHDAVATIRRRLGVRRVGHAGTLDPEGEGLLVVAVGPATRFLQYLPLEPKAYEIGLTFGIESTTLDSEGDLVNSKPVPEDLEARLREALPKFTGTQLQTPPMLSAVKVRGKPLYKYARKGEELDRAPREVRIESIVLVALDSPIARLRVACSGGTYMRVLAAELGAAVGCGAYLSSLSRTQVGKFCLSDALPPDAATPERLLSLAEALPPMPLVNLNAVQSEAIRQGRLVGLEHPPLGRLVAVCEGDGDVFGVAAVAGNQLHAECVLPIEKAHDRV